MPLGQAEYVWSKMYIYVLIISFPSYSPLPPSFSLKRQREEAMRAQMQMMRQQQQLNLGGWGNVQKR